MLQLDARACVAIVVQVVENDAECEDVRISGDPVADSETYAEFEIS